MSLSTTWYHGTIFSEIQEFKPFTHFGSRHVAFFNVDCCKQEKYRIDPSVVINPTIYKISIRFDESEVLTIKDWLTPRSIGLAFELRDHFKKKEDAKSKEYSVRFNEICESLAGKSDLHFNFDQIQAMLKRMGIKVLAYGNEVETDDKEISICIVDTSVINFDSIEKVKVTNKLIKEIKSENPNMKEQIRPLGFIPYEYDDE